MAEVRLPSGEAELKIFLIFLAGPSIYVPSATSRSSTIPRQMGFGRFGDEEELLPAVERPSEAEEYHRWV